MSMSLEDDEKKLAQLCKECGGKCCMGTRLSISEKELERLKKDFQFETKKLSNKNGSLNAILFRDKECPFLGHEGEKIGCIFNEKNRPLSCRMFPITFLLTAKGEKFFISPYCPFYLEAKNLKFWVKKTVREAREELNEWKNSEKNFRSSYYKKIHAKNKLVEL
jgi:Fe-S-cluster containining protein